MIVALAHYQFKAVHPFLDGNGRVGRLLITLFLIERQILPTPLLYLSAFCEASRRDYYGACAGSANAGHGTIGWSISCRESPALQRAIERLERASIAKRVGDAKRDPVYCATALLDVSNHY